MEELCQGVRRTGPPAVCERIRVTPGRAFVTVYGRLPKLSMISEFAASYVTTSFLCSLLPLLCLICSALLLCKRYKRHRLVLRFTFTVYALIYIWFYSSMIIDAAVISGNVMLVRFLISCGAANDKHLVLGHSPLLMASGTGRDDVVRLLLQEGANPNAANKYGYTPLWKAAAEGYTTVVQQLIGAGADTEIRNSKGRSVLMEACETGYISIASLLLPTSNHAAVDGNGNRALHLAANRGHKSIVSLLLQHGAHVDAPNGSGATALMFAARNGHLDVVQILLVHGADPHKGAAADSGERGNEVRDALWFAKEMVDWQDVDSQKKERLQAVILHLGKEKQTRQDNLLRAKGDL